MRYLLSRFLYMIYLLRQIAWRDIYRAIDSKSTNIVWIMQNPGILNWIRYLNNNNFLNDAALISELAKQGVNFRIRIGKEIGPQSGRTIFYTITNQFNWAKLANHSCTLTSTIDALERQGNRVYPPLSDTLYWENKVYMHESFDRLGIPTPSTIKLTKDTDLTNLRQFDYPAIVKEPHSAGSSGIHKIANYNELLEATDKLFASGIAEILFQKLVDMRRDLRVTFVRDRIVLHYWRINNSNDWKPTSTSHGSTVDFESFPDDWLASIRDYIDQLGIVTGAFDITWTNDDLSTTPLVLEVSPAYMPNPPQRATHQHLSYDSYKKVIFPKPFYLCDFIDIVFSIKEQVVSEYINDMSRKEERCTP